MATDGRAIWGFAPAAGEDDLASAEELRAHYPCHPVVARLLWNRGFRSPEALTRFLKPELSQLPDPLSIIDMKIGSERAARAVLAGEKIAVYGDYDVDGTCGASLLIDFFRSLGLAVTGYQPDRFKEGYGVHVAAIEKLAAEGARLILTVDCGITAVAPAKRARELGVDLVIIDHHKVGAELPDAFAIINPQRPEDSSGLLNVCGAGLAFFFAAALRARLREEGYFDPAKLGRSSEPNLARLLDLVAIATIADVVDVRGVNRILVSHGLSVMRRNPRPGIKALLEAAGIDKPVAMHCGFVLGPRINAAGRLETARAALELLTCESPERARELALALEQVNTKRRAAQDAVHAGARAQAQAFINDPRWARLAEDLPGAAFGPWPRTLVLAPPEGESWHEGVVGIVASKIVEEFGRPAFVLTDKEGFAGVLKGSARSVSKIDILSAISAESVACHLLNFGGHAHAGGVTLEHANLDAFSEALNLHLALTSSEEHYRRERRFDVDVGLDEVDEALATELERLEPFGHNFPEPVLKLSNVACADVRVMKEKHLKVRFVGAGGGSRLEAVWFNAARNPELEGGKAAAFWVSPSWNEWQGRRRLQLLVKYAEVQASHT